MPKTDIPQNPMTPAEIFQAAKDAYAQEAGLKVLIFKRLPRQTTAPCRKIERQIIYRITFYDETIVQGENSRQEAIGYAIEEIHSAFPIIIEKK